MLQTDTVAKLKKIKLLQNKKNKLQKKKSNYEKV